MKCHQYHDPHPNQYPIKMPACSRLQRSEAPSRVERTVETSQLRTIKKKLGGTVLISHMSSLCARYPAYALDDHSSLCAQYSAYVLDVQPMRSISSLCPGCPAYALDIQPMSSISSLCARYPDYVLDIQLCPGYPAALSISSCPLDVQLRSRYPALLSMCALDIQLCALDVQLCALDVRLWP